MAVPPTDRAARAQPKKFPTVCTTQVTVLNSDHHMFNAGLCPAQQEESRQLAYGCFNSDSHVSRLEPPHVGYGSKDFPDYDARFDTLRAVAGSGSDTWFKVTPSLLAHARTL